MNEAESAIAELQREVAELRQAHAKATSGREQYRALYMQLLERCRLLERGIVAGKKAERFAGDDANQLSMHLLGMLLAKGEAPTEETEGEGEGDDLDLDLGDLEDGDDDDAAATDEPGDTCLPKRRRRGRRKLPEALPRVEIEIVPEEVQREGLDAFKRIGEVVSESVERRPASLVVLRLSPWGTSATSSACSPRGPGAASSSSLPRTGSRRSSRRRLSSGSLPTSSGGCRSEGMPSGCSGRARRLRDAVH